MSRAERLLVSLWAWALLLLPLGARAAETFDEVVASAKAGDHSEALARMERFVAAHAGEPQAARGLVWMAQLHRQDGRPEVARPLLARAAREGAGTEWALHARKGLADLALESRDFAEAIEAYDALAREPSPLWQYVGRNAGLDARGERDRFRILLALAAAVGLFWLLRLVRARPPLWPPPRELIWLLPLLRLVALSAPGQEPGEARALCIVSAGCALLLWLNGAWASARVRGTRAALLHAALGAVQMASVAYGAVVVSGLWGKLIDTIAMGGE
jgi:Tetratricopeptide repeat-like domain